ncbi:glycosyltransferase family 20 protein [Sphaerobolus stellatus SS14]|uniref:Glycosyltransferase family 20 protein n=1 Tax=Sphaerobolus stellatus (strain SS14) TaxID=990650 RepID=A0A0C9UXJ1_SPHS4|nr:glycosyltransferase family 20 protein [Sphaerobolus stellatus SS14]
MLWHAYTVPDAPRTKVLREQRLPAVVTANRKFADTIIKEYEEGDIVLGWVVRPTLYNDANVDVMLSLCSERRPSPRPLNGVAALPNAIIGLFLHVAWLSSEIFRCMVVREQFHTFPSLLLFLRLQGVRKKLEPFEVFLIKYPSMIEKAVLLQLVLSTTEDDDTIGGISGVVARSLLLSASRPRQTHSSQSPASPPTASPSKRALHTRHGIIQPAIALRVQLEVLALFLRRSYAIAAAWRIRLRPVDGGAARLEGVCATMEFWCWLR